MAVVAAAYNFFNYPKRNNELQKAIAELETEVRATRLKKLCTTRWVERHESVLTFLELLAPILHALNEIIASWTDKDAISSSPLPPA